jgi:hypothetical protein
MHGEINSLGICNINWEEDTTSEMQVVFFYSSFQRLK